MGSSSRKFLRDRGREVDKLTKRLLIGLSKPDSECDKCEKEPTPDCFMTCKELCQRNKELESNKMLMDKIKALTGDPLL